MSITDPLADMFTIICNGQSAGKSSVFVPTSKLKIAVSEVLKTEGYIQDIEVININGKSAIKINLKYFNGFPVISKLVRYSKPGKRVYKGKNDIPLVIGGLGVSILSTSIGVVSDSLARANGLGGEVLCHVS